MFKYHGILENRDRKASRSSRDRIFYASLAMRPFAPKMIWNRRVRFASSHGRVVMNVSTIVRAVTAGRSRHGMGNGLVGVNRRCSGAFNFTAPGTPSCPAPFTSTSARDGTPLTVRLTGSTGVVLTKNFPTGRRKAKRRYGNLYDTMALCSPRITAVTTPRRLPSAPRPPVMKQKLPPPVVTDPSALVTDPQNTGTETQEKLPVKEEEEKASHKSEEEWVWGWDANDWNGWSGHWSEPKRNSRHSRGKSLSPSEKSTPTIQPEIVTPMPEEVVPESNVAVSSFAVVSEPQSLIPAASHQPTPSEVAVSIPASPVTVVSEPQSLTTAVSHRPTLSVTLRANSMQVLMELQSLSLTGPPRTRERRLARQAQACQLTSTPDLYNHLVSGEALESTAPDGAASLFPQIHRR